MTPLLLAAILALHAPPARPTSLDPAPTVSLALDRPTRETPPERIAVTPRPGARVLALHRPGG